MIISNSLTNMLLNIRYESDVADLLLTPLATTTEYANYFSIRKGLITFMPNGRTQVVNMDGTWKRDGRQEGRPSRVARKMLTEASISRLTDKDFELFASKLRAQDPSALGEFRLVSGDDIRTWYSGETYKPKQGTLNGSCMRYEHCGDWLHIYADHPDVVKMLCLVDPNDNRLLARALVWETDKGTFLDRVYGSDVSVEAFHEYAEKERWLRRVYNTYGYETKIVLPDGTQDDVRFKVDLDKTDYRHYPYMDTLKYLSYEGYVTNSNRRQYDRVLTSAEGEAYPR